jgi:general secretion pathway protein G
MRFIRNQGFSLIELIITISILAIMVGLALPLTRNTIRRERETELKRTLYEVRAAIDKYKEASDRGQIDVKLGTEGYPESLQVLVDGVSIVGSASDKKLKFLRRIPVDPMTNSTEWGQRSYQDDPRSTSWGGQNVFDIYTKSEGIALDGTKYKEW